MGYAKQVAYKKVTRKKNNGKAKKTRRRRH